MPCKLCLNNVSDGRLTVWQHFMNVGKTTQLSRLVAVSDREQRSLGHVIVIQELVTGLTLAAPVLQSPGDLAIVIPEHVFRPLEGGHHTGDVDQGPGPRPEVDVGRPQDGGDAPRPQHLGHRLVPPRGQGRGRGGGRRPRNQTNHSHLHVNIDVLFVRCMTIL